MADLNAAIQKIKSAMESSNKQQLDAYTKSYNQQLSDLTNTFNAQKAQQEQVLKEIPSLYNGQRNAADITKNQALQWLPQRLADIGAATESGANYIARTNIANQYQKNLSAIGEAQNKAIREQQNNIENLRLNYQTNAGKLKSQYMTDYANILQSQAQNYLNHAISYYQTEVNKELEQARLAEQRREAEAQLALQRAELAEKKREYNLSLAASRAKSSANSLESYIQRAQKLYSGSNGNGYYVNDAEAVMDVIKTWKLSAKDIDYIADHVYSANGYTLAYELNRRVNQKNTLSKKQKMQIATGRIVK